METKYWDKAVECMEREKLQELQLDRLKWAVQNAYDHVGPYRRQMDEAGVLPGDVKTLADLAKLPFTTKQDLRDTYPHGRFGVPLKDIVRIHASSGTTGKSTVVGYTRNDINNWTEMVARSFVASGASAQDVVQISYGYGLFTGGLGAHYGAERLGAAVVPASGGNTKKQATLIQDFGVTVLACTPSYALHIAETMEEMGIDPHALPLRVGVFGAEPWTKAMRNEIDRRLGITAHDIYGLSEVMGPGVSIDCEVRDGLHVWEDHFIPEIIHPETGAVLPYGQKGELVFTGITKEGIPMIRYRTRDLSSLSSEPCPCGRTHVRMSKISARSDDMLIIRGVNVFPSQVESVLLEIGAVSPNYHLIVDRIGALDTLEVQVEISETMFSDKVKRLEELNAMVRRELEGLLGVSCKVTLVEPKTLPRSEGKAVRVTDRRKLAD